MGKLNDLQIKKWVTAGEHFAARGDGAGLYLCFPEKYAAPFWRLRYKFKQKARVMLLGKYPSLTLSAARKRAETERAKVTLGHDPAGEKQEKIRKAQAQIERDKNAVTVGQLADEFFERMIVGRWKHPSIVRSRIERYIKPAIGRMAIEDVKPSHVDALLRSIAKKGVPSMANDVLRWLKRILNYAIKRHMVQFNAAAAFDLNDAGGKTEARERTLSRDELVMLFEAMRNAKGFSAENVLTVKLLLMLAVRKQELTGARIDEFDLNAAIWHLPAERTKTSTAIDIPLPAQAVECVRELQRMAGASQWLLPARKMQHRMIPHIHENTLNVALSKVKPLMKGVDTFCIHDFRRTARTQLAALGIAPHIAERCLNHKIKGIEGTYNRHDYFEERKAALELLAAFLESCEKGRDWVVTPLRRVAK